MSAPIEDYGIVGNTRTAALVGRDGSIDWMCLPRFDSESVFGALLGDAKHGRLLIAPADPIVRTSRGYRGETGILETQFETADGAVTVTDFMPIAEHEDQVDLFRIVCGTRGRVRMRTEIILRFEYGRAIPWVRQYLGGPSAVAGPNAVQFVTPVELRGTPELTTVGEFTVEAGQTVPFTMSWCPSHHRGFSYRDPQDALLATETGWRDWSSQCTFKGRWREAVIRSLITLKMLTFTPTGGIVAAATTSLPEQIGGIRNWDYRLCWLRDATLTLYALLSSGYRREARAWREWLLRAVAGHPAEMQIMYGLSGERRLTEYEIDWLPGYADSRPRAEEHQDAAGVARLTKMDMGLCHRAYERWRRADVRVGQRVGDGAGLSIEIELRRTRAVGQDRPGVGALYKSEFVEPVQVRSELLPAGVIRRKTNNRGDGDCSEVVSTHDFLPFVDLRQATQFLRITYRESTQGKVDHFAANSSAAATATSVASLPGPATVDRPTGRPSTRAPGMLTSGTPVSPPWQHRHSRRSTLWKI